MKVKICGLTRLQDALFANAAGADYLGLVFHPASPRFVPLDAAVSLARSLREECSDIALVGVFADHGLEEIQTVADGCGLQGVQLHGNETPKLARQLQESGLQVIKAIRVANLDDIRRTTEYGSSIILFDTRVEGVLGGTGRTFDWTLTAHVPAGVRYLLSGGLTADNVRQACSVARPWGVDASSGIEASPGVKDPSSVARFIVEAKGKERAR